MASDEVSPLTTAALSIATNHWAVSPGSDAALERGCLCPVLDNGHGRGVPQSDGDPLYWVNAHCPLHGWRVAQQQEGSQEQ